MVVAVSHLPINLPVCTSERHVGRPSPMPHLCDVLMRSHLWTHSACSCTRHMRQCCGFPHAFPPCWRSCPRLRWRHRSLCPWHRVVIRAGACVCSLTQAYVSAREPQGEPAPMPAHRRHKPSQPQTTKDYLSTLEHAIRTLVHSHIHFVSCNFCHKLQARWLFWLSAGTEEIILTKH